MNKPEIDEMICLKCGMCCGTCPQVFSQKAPGTVPEVADLDDYSEFAERIEQAASFCPVSAIETE